MYTLYHSAEQFYHKEKCDEIGDRETGTKIMEATTPLECYKISQNVKNYDHKHWQSKAKNVLYGILKLKYSQNPEYMKFLKNTGKTLIIEASARNKTWSAGVSLNSRDLFVKEKWTG